MKLFNTFSRKLTFFTIGIIGLLTYSTDVNAQADFNSTTNTGLYSSSLGLLNNANGNYSTALGDHSNVNGTSSFAFGHYCTVNGESSIAIGTRASTNHWHTVAIGVDVKSNSLRSMTIGTGGGVSKELENDIENSLMIGFNSKIPTLFVGPSSNNITYGKVGIGTTNVPNFIGGVNISRYSLYVAGGMLADEVRVRTGWADYVFLPNYDLKPLTEVADFIEKNGHLPNVPSAQEVMDQGLELGEISTIQQEKIEELTLYVIDQQKEIKAISDKLVRMQEKIDILINQK